MQNIQLNLNQPSSAASIEQAKFEALLLSLIHI